jgi:hypothetical protein
VSIGRTAISAIGKLLIVVLIGAAFVAGFFWTLRQSLYSPEVSVPNLVGKDVSDGEEELGRDGLNMRRRATRYSADAKPNTILDQSPHPGEIIKSGQTVAVVISRSTANEGETSVPVGSETPDPNANTNTPPANTNEANTSNTNSSNTNTNKNRNRNKNSNNANNSNNSNNRNGNKNANNRNGNNNNASGNKNANAPVNHNANTGAKNTNQPKPNANAPKRDRVVNGANRPVN